MAPHHSSLALLALVAACVPAGAVSGIATPGCVSSTSGVTDYYPIKVSITDLPATTTTVLNATTVTATQLFTVTYANTYKYVQDLRGTPKTYVLYQCGSSRPSDAVLKAAQPGYNATTAQFFQIPITFLACGSTTALNYLELLGVQSAIKVLDLTYVTSPCLMRLAECGQITQASSASMDYMPTSSWLAATSDVQLVLTDSYGTGATGTARDVALDASFDMGLQARGEWIKFVSLFFNAEATANAYYSTLSTTLTADLAAGQALLQSSSSPPVVAFIAYSAYNSGWFIYNATYKVQLIADAGGVLVKMPTTAQGANYSSYSYTYGAMFTNVTAFKAALRGVNVVIDETFATGSPQTYTWQSFLSTMAFTASDLTSGVYPFLTASRVFRNDKTINDGAYGGYYGLDWFASAVSQPQQVVNDFIAALYPTSVLARNATTRWLRNIAVGQPVQVITSAMCTDNSITGICGGPTAYVTVPYLNATTFTPAALQATVLALLPSGTSAQLAVTDFPVSATLVLSGASVNLPQGTSAFLGALGSVLGYPVVSASSGNTGRHLMASGVSLPVLITGLGQQVSSAAALVATLGNATAMLAAVNTAGAAGVTGVATSNVQVSASVTITIAGSSSAAGFSALQASVASGGLNAALIKAGMAQPAPPASSAARIAPLLGSLLALLFALLC